MKGRALQNALTPERFTEKLRQLLGLLKVLNPELYTTHCFRRGAARSILKLKLDPSLLKAAGLWSSNEWSKYISPNEQGRNVLAKLIIELEEDE
jgi:hypothetical protein